jgi:uncharacterized protein (DUF362 family)
MPAVDALRVGRRRFCGALGSLALLQAGCGGCQGVPGSGPATLPGAPPGELSVRSFGSGASRVVEARWAAAADATGRVDAAAVRTLLAAAMAELGGARPWSDWAGPARRLSIKVNTISCQAFTHPEVAAAVAGGLVGAGCDPSRVTVWDRDTFGLKGRGYTLDATGASAGHRCLGSDTSGAGMYQGVMLAGQKVYLSRLLLDSDTLVSVAALKDHSMAGVSLTLKNNFGMIQGADLLHGNVRQGSGCEPGISELAALPEVRGRLGLAVVDALVGVCQGGPGRADAQHVFRYGGILVGRDPVAVDRRGLAIIEEQRARLGLEPLARRVNPNPSPPVHIDNAASRGVSPT